MALVEHTASDFVTRVEDWHGLEPSKFGELQRFDFVSAGKDTKEWAELECFLFTDMMIMAKENRENDRRSYTVKGSILWREHVTKIARLESESNALELELSVKSVPKFYLGFKDSAQLEAWRSDLEKGIN